ncbi:hypothetical protein [Rhizobium lentis]|uniref:hypothetical protein n=1 Tax=Rhizobium lentis TaxID=1138194 RepID=UPI001C8335D5|nr:hypothetical protein [Rhizobium lentis]MBX4956272.1 hypothetical protein [Rhizobium lentis]MBX4974675.1 hypothetical protein [Rhizobium lentis]MBX4985969.1 hypothetical protein [Rhizobium lentis]MBX5004413.1 hypothetical protein [Rhizobium lentis]MBX5028866.1 hypothetical protein [Rhizobium lentis]
MSAIGAERAASRGTSAFAFCMMIPRGPAFSLTFRYARKFLKEAEFAKGMRRIGDGTGKGG